MNDIVKITQAIRSVAKKNNAVFALLFGSHARGTATSRSDIDVIFVEETTDPFLRRLDRYMNPLFDELKSATEVFVYTPDEFKSMKEGFFVRKALSEGVVIFERGKDD